MLYVGWGVKEPSDSSWQGSKGSDGVRGATGRKASAFREKRALSRKASTFKKSEHFPKSKHQAKWWCVDQVAQIAGGLDSIGCQDSRALFTAIWLSGGCGATAIFVVEASASLSSDLMLYTTDIVVSR